MPGRALQTTRQVVVAVQIKPQVDPSDLSKVRDQLNSSFRTLAFGAGAGGVALGGFAAAASPAAVATLAGSIRLAAGEIGIMLIPAVIAVSRVMQGLASGIRFINDIAGGFIGRAAALIAVPLTFVALGAAAVGAVKWIWSMATAAAQAAAALTGLALRTGVSAAVGAGGTALVAGAAGGAGAAGAAGAFGIMGLSTLGKVATGVAGAGVLIGTATGGRTGGGITGASIGGWIGGAIGSLLPGIGTAIGVSVGAALGGTLGAYLGGPSAAPKLGFDFQGQRMMVEDLDAWIQHQAIRDPLQQETANMQARAMEALAKAVGYLSDRIGDNASFWKSGN